MHTGILLFPLLPPLCVFLERESNNPISLTSADPLLACWTVQKVEEQGRNTEALWQSHSWDGLAPGKEDQELEKRNWVFNKYCSKCWDWGWFSKRGQLYVDSWFLNLCNISFLLPPVSLSSLAHVLTSKNWREYGRICSHGHEIELFWCLPLHTNSSWPTTLMRSMFLFSSRIDVLSSPLSNNFLQI